MTEPGEIPYQELTITIKDVGTDKITTFTGRVKYLEIVMLSEPDPILPVPLELISVAPARETIKVHLMGEWVVRHGRHYLMTVLDEPVEVEEEGK